MTYDVIVFPVIDWTFRLQRPQQLARELGRRGNRVFYLKVTFAADRAEQPYRFWDMPSENVYVLDLVCPAPHPNVYKQLPTPDQKEALLAALAHLRENCGFGPTVSIVDLPFWREIAMSLPGNLVLYDCMDYHPGFLNNEKAMLDEEDRLIQEAHLVVTTAPSLQQIVAPLRESTLIRNACDVDHFLPRPDRPVRRLSERNVVGYFGAIDHWFDIDLLSKSAHVFPDWEFVLIGSSHGCDVSEAKALPNVHFLGEIPYAILPEYVHGFDVCTIPFLISDLTLHTNPVKMYEYLAAGKPMVGTAMPEIMIGGEGLTYVAESHDQFIAHLATAMASHNRCDFVEARIEYARGQTWEKRVDVLEAALDDSFPRVSVVVLTYNNLALTQKCLASLEEHTRYPDLELIVVDNASSDGSQDWLSSWASRRPWVRLVLNERNLGFAAGNNVGLRIATGEYLVLLNNDTQVTRGWIFDLLRHMKRDASLGLIGPVTNNIGNEAKIDLTYDTLQQMHEQARLFVQARRMQELHVDTVAFFCAMLSREAYELVGELDERFTIGSFEDDDYCRRLRDAGYKIAIADDVFIHHELSATLNQLGAAKRKDMFEHHKRLYEDKWGPWTPHRYRDRAHLTRALDGSS